MSKNTNWKNLGRKQGANMKNFRNMKVDKMMYNDGKWNTVYSDDDIKRLAYYNIDLPHVVGIGTDTPFSRLSFGDSKKSGNHVSGILTPGKLASIALHEKTVQEEGLDIKKGQEFNGLGYVTNLRSVRSNINNIDANGVGIFSNKFISATDTSQKTDNAIMYITDDKHVQIGGVPTGYNLIDRHDKIIRDTQETGPNIILDVSGSMHVNGFINFLKNGIPGGTTSQQNDNPANQLTLNPEANPVPRIEFCDPTSKTKTDNRSVPDGAIFVGFDKDPLSDNLGPNPRLYIMVNGIQKRIATEDDKEFYEDNNSGFTFTGNNGVGSGKRTYVFRNIDDNPGNTLINTFSGITGDQFDGLQGGVSLPQTYDGNLPQETSALQVLGNLSVFDSKYGGTDLSALDSGNLEKARQILVTEIYDNTSLTDKPGRELGTIYTDRHIMIGGQKYSTGIAPNLTFPYFGSAIDISGGITGKPAIRLISGSNNGSIKSSNPKDSIIIGNTPKDHFETMNKECILVGQNTKYDNNENTLVMGNTNTVKNTKNSLIVGNNLDVSFNSVTEGVVVLGVGDNNLEVNGDDRIVFATNDGNNAAIKALTVDKDGNVTIIGNLNVQGDEIILDVEHKVVQDGSIKLAGKDGDDGNGNHQTKSSGSLKSAGATTNPPATEEHEAGLKIFIHKENDTNNFVQWTFDETNNDHVNDYDEAFNHTSGINTDADRWTTAMSSRPIGIAAVASTITAGKGVPGTEKFKVLNNGNLEISSNGTDNKFTVQASSGDLNINNKFKVTGQDGHVDMSGNLHIHGTGGITLGKDETITNANDGTVLINGDVAAGTGSAAGVFKSNGDTDVILKTGNSTTGSITIEDALNGHIKITPQQQLRIFDEYTADTKGAVFKKQSGNSKVDLEISGKLTVDGLIDPTGLILDNHDGSDLTISNGLTSSKLGIYNSGGTLKFKFNNGVNIETSTIPTSSSGGTIPGTIQNAETANNLKKTPTGAQLLYQSGNNATAMVANAIGNKYLKAGATAAAAPAFATISTDDLSEGTNKFFTDARARGAISGSGDLSYDSNSGVMSYSTPTPYSLPTADSTNLGGIKVDSNVTLTGKQYPVLLNNSSIAYVAVPWEDNTDPDTNTTYTISSETNSSSGAVSLRLTAGGDGSGTDDVIFATDSSLTVSETGETITYGLGTTITPETITLHNGNDRTISVGGVTSGAGKDLTISAGATTDVTVVDGGNLKLSGGSSTGGKQGNVNITGAGIYLNAQDGVPNDRYPILINGAALFKMPTTKMETGASADKEISAKNLINGRLITSYDRPSNGTLGLKLPPVKDICNLIDNLAGANMAEGYSFKFIWDTTPITNTQSARLNVPGTGYSYVGRAASTGSVEINILYYFEQFADRVQEYTCLIKTWSATNQTGNILIMEAGFGTVVSGQIA